MIVSTELRASELVGKPGKVSLLRLALTALDQYLHSGNGRYHRHAGT